MDAVRLSALRAAVVGSLLAGEILAGSPLGLLPAAALAQSAAVVHSPAQTTSERIATLLDRLRRVRTPETAAVSPVGSFVAWTAEGDDGWELHLTSIANLDSQPAPPAIPDRILSPDTLAD